MNHSHPFVLRSFEMKHSDTFEQADILIVVTHENEIPEPFVSENILQYF